MILVDVYPTSRIIRGMMINETERDNRSMFLHYMIENLENGLKYVEREAKTDSTKWEYIKKTIEKMDADLERLVVVVKNEKEMEEEQIRYEDQLNDFNWVGSKHHY